MLFLIQCGKISFFFYLSHIFMKCKCITAERLEFVQFLGTSPVTFNIDSLSFVQALWSQFQTLLLSGSSLEMVPVELLQAATVTYRTCQYESISCTTTPTGTFPVTQSVTSVILFYAPQVIAVTILVRKFTWNIQGVETPDFKTFDTRR